MAIVNLNRIQRLDFSFKDFVRKVICTSPPCLLCKHNMSLSVMFALSSASKTDEAPVSVLSVKNAVHGLVGNLLFTASMLGIFRLT